jgi:ribosome-binding protein aMBF1 (putative translation factor)
MPLTFFEKDVNIQAGERIRVARRAIGLSQIELAEMLGITNDRLSRYESGKILVPAWVLMVVEREAEKMKVKSKQKSVRQS